MCEARGIYTGEPSCGYGLGSADGYQVIPRIKQDDTLINSMKERLSGVRRQREEEVREGSQEGGE